MATLEQALNADTSGYEQVSPQNYSGRMPAPVSSLEPVFNAMIRCPLPPTTATPDSLRQFYVGGRIPQVRIFSPSTSSSSNGTGTTIVNQSTTVINSSSSTSSGSTSTSLPLKTATLTTGVLIPGQQYMGVLVMAKSFQLLGLSANAACRVQLYGTASAQANDSSRALDVAPNAGTTQNIISDVVLDANPYLWSFQNRIGANADSPQTTVLYVTVTNVSASSTNAITISYAFVPLET